jgi:manganese transport protein
MYNVHNDGEPCSNIAGFRRDLVGAITLFSTDCFALDFSILTQTCAPMSSAHYIISSNSIKEPPTTLLGKLKHLGPGFILSASIVGSGELIATTTLGATAGFAAFWIIIISCLVKVTVQLEFGKHTIVTGETAMQAFTNLPGPRFGKGKWSVWTILFIIIFKVLQLGGMTGSTAIVLNMLFPTFSITVWVFITALITSVLIYKGYYSVIEKFSLFMIAMFTLLTITAVFSLKFTAFAFTAWDVILGQQFQLSGAIVTVAIGAFGITGVASDEIIAYNYWCLEKGYAAFTGPHQHRPTSAHRRMARARTWLDKSYVYRCDFRDGDLYISNSSVLFARRGSAS